MQNQPRKLILNADDYGAHQSINTAVEELIKADLLGGVSILANGQQWEAAVAFLRAHPTVSAGIHLNLIEGPPIAAPSQVNILLGRDGMLLPRGQLLQRWALSPFACAKAIELEWRAQIERLLAAGLQLVHADSHQHLHAFPLAFPLAVKLCRAYEIPALRLPREVNRIPSRTLTAHALRANLFLGQWLARSSTLRHNDHFLGFKRAGGYGLRALLDDLPHLQPGITELALHPSTRNFEPYPSLHGNDEREAILSPSFREAIEQSGIVLTSWKQL